MTEGGRVVTGFQTELPSHEQAAGRLFTAMQPEHGTRAVRRRSSHLTEGCLKALGGYLAKSWPCPVVTGVSVREGFVGGGGCRVEESQLSHREPQSSRAPRKLKRSTLCEGEMRL